METWTLLGSAAEDAPGCRADVQPPARRPWWFNERYCADAAVPDDPSQIGGPGENGWVSLEEWEAMPEGLKPLMAHRCHELGWDVTQQSVR